MRGHYTVRRVIDPELAKPVEAAPGPCYVTLVPCGGSKLDEPAMASELYTGGYFKACYAYARRLRPMGKILILSAKHGLVEPWVVLEPYNVRFGMAGAVGADIVRKQADKLGITHLPVLAIGGRHYTDMAGRVFKRLVVLRDQMECDGAIGKQLRWMKQASATPPEGIMELIEKRHG